MPASNLVICRRNEMRVMNDNTQGLTEVQQRFMILTKQIGLEDEEALHALGRRRGCLPEYRKLTQQEQFNKVQEYISYGLTDQEARNIVGLTIDPPAAPNGLKTRAQRKNVPSLDWMPAKKAYNSKWPARSRKGLLK